MGENGRILLLMWRLLFTTEVYSDALIGKPAERLEGRRTRGHQYASRNEIIRERVPKEKGRPPYFLFDPQAWNGSKSIRGMVPSQLGWYIQLLADSWLSTETPQATLLNNPEQLKGHARFTQTLTELKEIFDDIEQQLKMGLFVVGEDITAEKFLKMVNAAMGMLWQRHLERLEARWSAVMEQFKTQPYGSEGQELVYNPRQLAELRRWMDSYGQKVDAGSKGAQTRWGSVDKSVAQELRDPELVEPHPLLNGGAIAVPTESMADPGKPMANHGNIEYTTQKDVSKDDTSKKSTDSTVKSSGKTLLKKKPETLFDEEKFRLTEKMSAYLTGKHPDFVAGDWDFMVEKFKNVNHGKVYTSWSRTFYNFVVNQRAMYGYRPGAFNYLQSDTKSQPRNSTAERHAAQEKANEDYTNRLLQSDNQSVDTEDSEALPLAPGDVR